MNHHLSVPDEGTIARSSLSSHSHVRICLSVRSLSCALWHRSTIDRSGERQQRMVKRPWDPTALKGCRKGL
jgi:hypothetical protein